MAPGHVAKIVEGKSRLELKSLTCDCVAIFPEAEFESIVIHALMDAMDAVLRPDRDDTSVSNAPMAVAPTQNVYLRHPKAKDFVGQRLVSVGSVTPMRTARMANAPVRAIATRVRPVHFA